MINTALFRPRNLLVIAIVVIFARSLLHGFVKLVDGDEDSSTAAASDDE